MHLQFLLIIIKVLMQKRKVWTEEEDRILKFLKEEREEKKWSHIAKIMENEFNIIGRTSKQCRERYHNHLDSTIKTDSWRSEQNETLLQLHEQIGNKWSTISQHLPGRTDNCIKNHFYSKLRKSIRKLNKIILEHFQDEYPPLKEKILSKIIETQQTRFNNSSKVDEELADFCNDIKKRLFLLDTENQEPDEQQLSQARRVIIDIQIFENNYKKGYKAIKKSEFQLELNYLQPPEPRKTIKRRNSAESSRSQDSSFLSSSSCISSCSDLSEYDQNFDDANVIITTQKVRRGSFTHLEKVQKEEEQEGESHQAMQAEDFLPSHHGLIEEQSSSHKLSNEFQKQLYIDNIMYDNTPMTARILPPAEVHLDVTEYPLFPHQPENDDFIEYKEEEEA